jgi:hypothetical protein
MNLVHKIFVWSALLCIFATDMTAQLNPVYLQIQKNRKAISKGRHEIRPGLTFVEYYVDMGYDDATLARLKKIGVDVEGTLFKRELNEKEKAVRSDCIVIGTVVRLEHPNDTTGGRTTPEYNTIAYIDVEEYLRNDYHLTQSTIPVVIQSGPQVERIGEIKLQTDEHVLLFLTATGVIAYAEYNTPPAYFKKVIQDTTVRFEILGFDGKYVFFSDKVWGSPERGSRSLFEVKKDIQTVVAAVKRAK